MFLRLYVPLVLIAPLLTLACGDDDYEENRALITFSYYPRGEQF